MGKLNESSSVGDNKVGKTTDSRRGAKATKSRYSREKEVKALDALKGDGKNARTRNALFLSGGYYEDEEGFEAEDGIDIEEDDSEVIDHDYEDLQEEDYEPSNSDEVGEIDDADDENGKKDIPLWEMLMKENARETELANSHKSNKKRKINSEIYLARREEKNSLRRGTIPNDSVLEKVSASQGKESKSKSKISSLTKRQHKHAPAVMRSDRPVKRFREILFPSSASSSTTHSATKSSDPRFSELAGKLNHRKFLSSYNFLDKHQEEESNRLKTAMKKVDHFPIHLSVTRTSF